MESVLVFCGSYLGRSQEFTNVAESLGKLLALNHLTLVYGGAKVGLMGKIANSCLSAGGKVIGVIPSFLQKKEIIHSEISELIIVSSMHERKQKMLDLCDAAIVLPGGYGTLDETFEFLTWAQLGLHRKPLGFLNTTGYFDLLFAFIEKMVAEKFLKSENQNLFIKDHTVESLLHRLQNHSTPSVRKWIENKEQT